MSTRPPPEISALSAGFRSRCPQCGEGKLFDGYLTVAERCDRCGLDYGFAEAGDGPVFFIVLIVGIIVMGAALTVEILYMPPYWVHLILWLPFTLILSLAMMRPFKALLLALQYRHQAAEGPP